MNQGYPSELTPEYVETLRRMTPQQKLRTASALYWGARRLKGPGLRMQHPEWTEAQIEKKVSEIFLHAST